MSIFIIFISNGLSNDMRLGEINGVVVLESDWTLSNVTIMVMSSNRVDVLGLFSNGR